MRNSIEEAMLNLCLEKHGDTEIYWSGNAENYYSLDKVKRIDNKELGFTWDEVLEKQKILDKEYLDTQYQRDRELSYPPIGDQLDMIYKDMKNGTTTHAEAVEAVKTKYPKG